MSLRTTGLSLLAGVLLGGWTMTVDAENTSPNAAARAAARASRDKGNFKDAYDAFAKLALDPQDEPNLVGGDLTDAVQCLRQLGRQEEIDDFREDVIRAHAQNWRLLAAAAGTFDNQEHYGYLVAGKFHRGQHRGGGQVVNAAQRDRVRALQLLVEALPLAQKDDDHAAAAELVLHLADEFQQDRRRGMGYLLQSLTDLSTLPDYEPGWNWGYGGQASGAPVDEHGSPVYYHVPQSFAKAASDGERWRWCLAEAAELQPSRADEAKLRLGDFLKDQFGVETLADYRFFFDRLELDDAHKDQSGTYALHTLADDETIARLATGIQRFKLPEEFDFIRIYRAVAAHEGSMQRLEATSRLAGIFQDRRQYPQAAAYWLQCTQLSHDAVYRSALEQIENNWGRFESAPMQPAGKGAAVDYRFRNGTSVTFTAHAVRMEKLLDDVKAYLKSRPQQLDWRKIDIGDIGYRLVEEQQNAYLGDQVATWTLALEPRANHFDRRITVTTPLQKAGAYLLSAQMEGGNKTFVLVWVADTAIVKKTLDGKILYYVADAVTGTPVPQANLELFGWQQTWNGGGNRPQINVLQTAETTNADGQAFLTNSDQQQNYQWLVIARSAAGRLAYLGFNNVWYGRHYDPEYNATKVYAITDRPVYRPDQKVHYKLWVRHAKYDQPDTSDFANEKFTVEIHNPKGEKVLSQQITSDAYGGVAGEYVLPADAPLGVYQVLIPRQGGGAFRVEEYKKPEFEVTVDAPREPVMLGDRIQATIQAKYYFGAPVTKARVKYKVTRTAYNQRWYPPGPWDWLFGPGYWWFAGDYAWYPGWRTWGCARPTPFWWRNTGYAPPEIVAEREVEIGPDGTLKVEIDTAVARAIHPDQDHQYTITAEVVDASRRTIVGSGEVLAARKPFAVTVWTDRGYYHVGDAITVRMSARTLDGKPVAGQGVLKSLRVTYADGKPVETQVQSFDVPTNVEGTAEFRMQASRSGQYRLSHTVTDSKGHPIEGGYLLTIRGEGFDGSDFRFNHIEIIPDRQDYQPGDKVRVMINTDRIGGTVLLFLRPTNGVYLPPEVIRLDGKSTLREIAVTQRDMPNFFVEALTVADGHVWVETREIVVPPEKRVLNVAVVPSAESYKPGQDAKAQIRLTDFYGKPFVGSTVVAIYDKSLEYISGGSNVAEIKQFFWKWRRHHNPNSEDNLERTGPNRGQPGKPDMQDLGVFGGSVADETEIDCCDKPASGFGRGTGGLNKGNALRMQSVYAGGGAMPMAAAAPSGRAVDALEANGAAVEKQWLALGAVDKDRAKRDGAEPAAGPLVEPTVRSHFADTALWVGALTTDEHGQAEVSLKMPENLTTWRIKVWAMGQGTKVGEAFADVVTRKDLIIRLEAPRFFVQTDEVVLSAIVHNYLKSEKSVRVALELSGGQITPTDELVRSVAIRPNAEARVDWHTRVVGEGETTIRMKALTDEDSDAMEQKFPCYVHGMLKTESYSGALRPAQESGKFVVQVPAQRRAEQTRLEVRYSPTLAGAMVDALPYLIDYPYGCTEQTLNRFLPAAITQKVLIELGLNLADIRTHRMNLNAQEIGDDSARAKQWKRYDRNPVFDPDELRRIVKTSLSRLTEMQLADGGWGWFSGWGEFSSPHLTATVVHGLQIAKANDVALVPGVLERGVAWLQKYQDEQVHLLREAQKKPKPERYKEYVDNLDVLVYRVLADAGVKNADMLAFLDRDRTRLSLYGLALYGLALEKQGERDKLNLVLQNLRQYLVEDEENQTAWLRLPQENFWWCWYGSEYETQAAYLQLLAQEDPKGEVAARLVKYLLNNRKNATYWNSTRDTALCVEAMADFLRRSGEQKPEMTVEVYLDGQLQKAVEITPATLFAFDNRFVIEGKSLADGPHTVELKRKGKGPLYYNGYLTNFTLEDHIAKAGLEIKVQRQYYRLVESDAQTQVSGARGQVVTQKVEKYRREPLVDLASVKSGELVEIELAIASKNDYEYLVFEDMKPAGFETVDQRSGYTGNALGAYVEFRDNRVVFFVRQLARGEHSVAYRMRAEIPGQFSALPARGAAMYAPELKANSDEIKLRVHD